MIACLLVILPQADAPVHYRVLYAGTPLGNPRANVPRHGPELPLLKEELFQLLRALRLPDAHIIGALTGDHLIAAATPGTLCARRLSILRS